jgi:carbon storage regulator CsrA
MLVLGRKKDERIHIGNDIVIVVNRCGVNQVSLAIEAPKDVKVVRGELFNRKESTDDNRSCN